MGQCWDVARLADAGDLARAAGCKATIPCFTRRPAARTWYQLPSFPAMFSQNRSFQFAALFFRVPTACMKSA